VEVHKEIKRLKGELEADHRLKLSLAAGAERPISPLADTDATAKPSNLVARLETSRPVALCMDASGRVTRVKAMSLKSWKEFDERQKKLQRERLLKEMEGRLFYLERVVEESQSQRSVWG
jgi:hypothetical protein